MERLAALFTTPSVTVMPVWIQQGGTGIWIRPTEVANPHLPPPPLSIASTSPPTAPPGSPTTAPTTTPTTAPTSTLSPDSAPDSTALLPPPPFILDPQAPPMPYTMARGSNSVLRLWTEWTIGLDGGPSIQALNRCWGARWRVGPSEPMFYSRRRRVMMEIQRRV